MTERLTAMEIENQRFGRRLRGYDPGAVDLFLRSVAEEVERLNREHGEMLEETGQLRRSLAELRSREETLQKTLVTAQHLTEEMKERAVRQSELLLQEARMRADALLKEAQDRLTRMDADISRSKIERDTFERRLRGILEQHLALLDLRREANEFDNLHVLSRSVGSEAG